MTTPTDIVVLDANCFKHLAADDVRDRVQRSLRASQLVLWPTALNVLEIAKNPHLPSRRRGLRAVAEFLDGRPLLPLPETVMREMGQAIAAGEDTFLFDASGFEWMLQRPDAITQEHIDEIEAVLAPLESRLQTAFRRARPKIRRFLKERGIASEWSSIPDFLDRMWYRREQLDDLIRSDWSRMELPEPAPVDKLFTNSVWRLHLEAFGAALFGRVLAGNEMPEVQANDIDQLVYLGTWKRAVFVTEDKACYLVAEGVLSGRHAGTRVLSWSQFLALA